MRILPRRVSESAARAELGRQPPGARARRRLRGARLAFGREHRLPARKDRSRRAGSGWKPLAAAGGDGGAAGRGVPGGPELAQAAPGKVCIAADSQVRERVLLVAVGDHLERSQMVLIELANAGAHTGVDISYEQKAAEDLLESNRLYRQTAAAREMRPRPRCWRTWNECCWRSRIIRPRYRPAKFATFCSK